MIRNIFFLIVLNVSVSAFSQEMVNSIAFVLKSNRDIFQIINTKKKETVLFLSDRKKITALLLNEKMLVSDSISSQRPDGKFRDIIGYSGDNSNPVIYWASSNRKEIFAQFYDFKNRKIFEYPMTLLLRDEKFLQYFTENGKFYMLTTLLDSNILNLYVFEKDKVTPHQIDLTALNILNDESKNQNFSKSLRNGLDKTSFLPITAYKLERIEADIFIPLTESSNKIKCYTNQKSLMITSDENTKFTQLIDIDLETFIPKIRYYDQKTIAAENMNTNSFVIDDKIFQLTLYSTVIYVTVKNLSGETLMEHSAVASEPIAFKNSDVVRQRSFSGSKRTLEKSSQFIKKINRRNCGISAYKLGENYLLTIGTVSDEKKMAMPSFGIGIASVGNVTISVNTANLSMTTGYFNSYANRDVIKMYSLLDKIGNHVQGDIPELAFDKMTKFSGRFYDLSDILVNRIGADYYMSYYNQDNKQYVIRQFTD